MGQTLTTFASQSGNVPASYLDTNFAQVNTSLTTSQSVASASTVDLGAQASNIIAISGTNTISSFGSSAVTSAPLFKVRATGAWVLAYNPTSMILPGAANYTALVGQDFICEYLGSGNWHVTPLPWSLSTNVVGFRNRAINGDMRVDQRNNGASQTITAGAAAAYTVDRFYATCTGANVTGQRVAGSGFDQYQYQFTGAASVTAIAFGQRFESTNVYDLAGQTVTFSCELANSLLTNVNWTAYYPTATDNWTGRTQIATGSFTVTSTLTSYAAQINLPTAAQAGLEIELTVGAQVSGTWKISDFQLEIGSVQTAFERLPITIETALCQRYYFDVAQGSSTYQWWLYVYNNQAYALTNVQTYFFPASMRTAPTIITRNVTVSGQATAISPGTINANGFGMNCTVGANGAGQVSFNYTANAEL